jgi:hypothetical protein
VVDKSARVNGLPTPCFKQIFVIFVAMILDSGGFVRVLTYNVRQENMMRTMVGKIASVDGVAEVIDARGQHHRLEAGDWLREGDRLVTSHGAAVTVETTVGGMVQVSESQTVTLSTQLSADFMANSSDDAVNPWLLQQVLAAIQSKDDVLDLSALLGGMPEEGAFTAFAADVDEQAGAPALHIADLIQDHAVSGASTSLVAGDVADFVASASLPSEVALQQSLLKDLMKD